MNDDMKISERGLKLIAAFEGKPRLKARRCEGGKWELSYGCTTDTKGKPFGPDSVCTEAEALELFDYHLDVMEAVVRRHVKVKLNQNQFDALVSLVYNIGEEQFATGDDGPSTVLRMINDEHSSRWEDAAEGFTFWINATKDADQRDPKEPIAWYLSPTNKPCPYRRKLEGLLRRHLAEACVFLGFDWEQACGPNAGIELLTRFTWNETRRRNEDVTVSKTELSSVLRIARNHPLPAEVIVPVPVQVIEAKIVVETKLAAPVPPLPAPVIVAKPAPVPGPLPAPKPQAPLPPKTIDIVNGDIGRIRIENGAKTMEQSDRAVAVGLKLGGIWLKTLAERRVIPAGAVNIYFEAVGDPVIVAFIVTSIMWMIGQCLLILGRNKRAKHIATASTLVY